MDTENKPFNEEPTTENTLLSQAPTSENEAVGEEPQTESKPLNSCEYCGKPVRHRFCSGCDAKLKSKLLRNVDDFADIGAAAKLVALKWLENGDAILRLQTAQHRIDKRRASRPPGAFDWFAVGAD